MMCSNSYVIPVLTPKTPNDICNEENNNIKYNIPLTICTIIDIISIFLILLCNNNVLFFILIGWFFIGLIIKLYITEKLQKKYKIFTFILHIIFMVIFLLKNQFKKL